jgi:hypothetical protein
MPRQFARDVVGDEARTVRRMGWHGTQNGEPLWRAQAAGFGAVVTMDRSMAFQQNRADLGLGIVVLRARSNRLEDLRPLAREVAAALDRLEPGEVRYAGSCCIADRDREFHRIPACQGSHRGTDRPIRAPAWQEQLSFRPRMPCAPSACAAA